MKNKSESLKIVQDDILRFKKNKLGQWLAYGGLAFSCLYITLLYAYHNETFYTMLMGASVMLTLAMLLTAFLCAEGVKVYNKKYCVVLLVLAAIEIARIFIYPAIGAREHAFWYTTGGVKVDRGYFGFTLSETGSRALLTVYLILSAAFFAAAAVYSYLVSVRHEKFNKRIEEGSVDVTAALKTLEEEENAQKAAAEVSAEEVE